MRRPYSDSAPQMKECFERLNKIENDLMNLKLHIVSQQTFVKNVEKHLSTDINDLPLPYFYFRLNEQILSLKNEMKMRFSLLEKIERVYTNVLAQQNEFMKQQSEVMKQQSSFIRWIKYATILLPIAAISIAIIEVISSFLGVG